MKFVHWFFGLNRIYEVKYGVGILIEFLLLYMLTGMISMLIQPSSLLSRHALALLLFILPVGYILRELARWEYVKRRVEKRKYIRNPRIKFLRNVFMSSVDAQHDGKDVETVTNVLSEGGFWQIYDTKFSFFRKTKYGRYKSKELYYTVFEAKLQRIVPHLMFDSKSAKGNQFRFNYLQSQRVSFEGNFDDIFESYAPQTYHIDTLSFVSPEVLEALVALEDCDIEFVDNKIMCFAPLLHSEEIVSLKERALNLYNKVNDNLDTYMDERLSGQQRRENITSFARQLLQNPIKYLPITILTGIGTGGIVYISSQWGWQLLFDRVSVLIWFTFAASLYNMIKLMIDNHQKEKAFFELRQ